MEFFLIAVKVATINFLIKKRKMCYCNNVIFLYICAYGTSPYDRANYTDPQRYIRFGTYFNGGQRYFCSLVPSGRDSSIYFRDRLINTIILMVDISIEGRAIIFERGFDSDAPAVDIRAAYVHGAQSQKQLDEELFKEARRDMSDKLLTVSQKLLAAERKLNNIHQDVMGFLYAFNDIANDKAGNDLQSYAQKTLEDYFQKRF